MIIQECSRLIRSRELQIFADFLTVQRKAETELVGKIVRITSSYNGQPYGHSRKPLTGMEFRITGVILDKHWGISLWLDNQMCSIGIDEVEFI